MGVDVKQSFWRAVWTGYVFWTILTSLPALIWFYPLNELKISGYETFVIALFSPYFLRYRRLREYLQSDVGDLLLKILSLVGIFSFRCPTTLLRLTALTIGATGTVLKFVCDLTLPDVGKNKYAFWGYTVGFMALLCTRIWYRSIMPAFNDHLSNLLVFFLTFLNILATIVSYEFSTVTKKERANAEKKPSPSFVLVSVGAGSLFYVMHAVFGEVSTPCRWISGPYPNTGPQTLPLGLAVYFALLVGIWVSPTTRVVFHPGWSACAAASFLVMYTATGWSGFLGAIFLAVYTTSVWPTYIDLLFRQLPKDRVGPAFALVIFTYVLEILFSVWTVAYNFVPGGTYTRESTHYLIMIVILSIGSGLYRHRPISSDIDPGHLAFTKIQNGAQTSKSRVWSRLVLLAMLASAATMWRSEVWNPGSIADDRRNFSAMIWTYHFGYDNDGWPSLDRTARLIENLQADVVGLLETDASRPYMGNNDLVQWLAENLQMHVDFGPNTRKHTWGSALLSRFPIIDSRHHLLPSPRGELAPAISAVLNVSGISIGVVVTHFGNDVDDEDRKLQAKSIAEITSDFYDRFIPTVFLGYVTSKPLSRDYFTLLENGRMLDIDEMDGNRFCEYIFYNRLYRLAYGRISHGGLSDTEVQMAKFQIPDEKERKAEDFYDVYGKVTTDISKVPSDQRLPDKFGGFYSGHFRDREHHYHMFTPKYFLPSA